MVYQEYDVTLEVDPNTLDIYLEVPDESRVSLLSELRSRLNKDIHVILTKFSGIDIYFSNDKYDFKNVIKEVISILNDEELERIHFVSKVTLSDSNESVEIEGNSWEEFEYECQRAYVVEVFKQLP